MSQGKPEPLPCAAGCKRTVEDEAAASAAGWSFLPVTARYRCPHCERELKAADRQESPTV
jgi:hypothetical protein